MTDIQVLYFCFAVVVFVAVKVALLVWISK
jgi:hypothetical protein